MFFRKIYDSVMKRPLCYALAGFLTAYFTLGFLRGIFKMILFAVLFTVLFLAAVVFTVKRNVYKEFFKKYAFPLMLIIFTLAFALLFSWINFDCRLNEISQKYHGSEVSAEITVIKVNSMSEFYSSHDIIITEINGESCKIKARLTSTYFNTYDVGDTLRLPLKLTADNKYSDLSEAYDLSHGILIYAESENSESAEVLESRDIFPYTHIYPIQKKISLIIEKYANENGGALSRALVYGNRDGLPYAFTSAFKELGISHMLAISGMHFSIVVGLLAMALSKARIRKQFSVILLTLFVLFYALLAGFSASVVRAAFMLLFSYAAFVLGRKADSVTSLFIAGFLICIITPYAIYDIGMLLSFMSTFGILVVALPINERMRQNEIMKIKPLFTLLSALNITLSAVLFTLPVIHFCFGYISYVSPVANLLFIPLITVIMYLLPFLIVFSPLKYIAYPIGYLISLISDATVNFAQAFARSGDYYVRLDYPFCTVLFVLMLAAIFLIAVLVKGFGKHREIVYIPMILFVFLCYIGNHLVMMPYHSGMSVIYYTEDENDAVILVNDGNAMLCDSSDGSYSFTKNALDYAREVGKVDITSYMITDYHYNHIATVTKLIEQTEIRDFVLPVSLGRDKNFHYSVTKYLNASDCSVHLYKPRENSLIFGDFLLNVHIYEHETANPATLIFVEGEDQEIDSYMYISNTKDMISLNKDFREFITECSKRSDYVICASHGDAFEAVAYIEKYISYEPLYDSFYTKLK
ncbi:MAG: ComEC/Rec2 family competence protein [Ruminococcaceae bacterium]|nr:ComEC/Rec2 family competence protein [Oscillospiraceae bacterium]